MELTSRDIKTGLSLRLSIAKSPSKCAQNGMLFHVIRPANTLKCLASLLWNPRHIRTSPMSRCEPGAARQDIVNSHAPGSPPLGSRLAALRLASGFATCLASFPASYLDHISVPYVPRRCPEHLHARAARVCSSTSCYLSPSSLALPQLREKR